MKEKTFNEETVKEAVQGVMNMEVPRRDFLATACKVLAAGILAPIGGLAPIQKSSFAGEAGGETDWTRIWEGKQWGFVVDTEKCIGCARCVNACKQENKVPQDQEVFRTWVERYVETPEGIRIDSPNGGLDFEPLEETEEKQFFVPKLCNQCENPPCVQVCPVSATYRTGDGVVLVDAKRCVGCRYCIQACPYGARFLHPKTHVADKCTWCYHRVVKGLRPACVTVCPVGARKFGNLRDLKDPVTEIIRKERIRGLKPDMGTKPQVFYLGLDEVVV
ncbi:MAG TPA: 4Fe-4S dicluster domain-containing protein [Verrucomicrobiae bacterium]|nr:4Fe-4S dicluster domain-containing protein [Verrucomicrobiae bacterium]